MKPTRGHRANGHPGNDVCRLLARGGTYGYDDSRKAARELGFTHRRVRDVVRRPVAWLLDRGLVPAQRRHALTPHSSLRGAS